jgi:hypothetical protein
MKLATIKDFYQDINHYIFDDKLVMPYIGLCRWTNALGEYHGRGHRLSRMRFNRSLSIELAMPVIFHEMIHQYQYEILELNPDHGVTFYAFEPIAQGLDWPFGEAL